MSLDHAGRMILVVGTGTYTLKPPDYYLWVKRLTPDGLSDLAFGDNRFGGRDLEGNVDGSAVAVDAINRDLAAGFHYGNGDYGAPTGLLIVRFNKGGGLDETFANDGWTVIDFANQYVEATTMLVDAAGRIIVAGWAGASGNHDVALARLTPDGAPDPTFSGDGRLTLDLGGDDEALAAALDAEGRIVLAGMSDDHFMVARFNPDGALDDSFGKDGLLVSNLPGSASGVAVDDAGRIIVTGTSNDDVVVMRLRPDGTPDATFGRGDGGVITDLGGDDIANGMALDPEGRIVVTGSTDVIQPRALAVMRYLSEDYTHHQRLPCVVRP